MTKGACLQVTSESEEEGRGEGRSNTQRRRGGGLWDGGREGGCRGGPTCHLTATLLIPRHFHDNCFKRVTAPVAPAWPDNAPPAARPPAAAMASAAAKRYFFHCRGSSWWFSSNTVASGGAACWAAGRRRKHPSGNSDPIPGTKRPISVSKIIPVVCVAARPHN